MHISKREGLREDSGGAADAKRESIRKPAPTCATCRFGQPSPPTPRMARACRNPKMEYLRNPVSGWLPACSEVRADSGVFDFDVCGPDGRHWEPIVEQQKPGLFARIWRALCGSAS